MTTWTQFYIDHFGSKKMKNDVDNPSGPMRIIEELKGNPKENLMNLQSGNYFSFMFVRNPFDRLLSAYRDRIFHAYVSYTANMFIPKILKEEGIVNKITKHFKNAPKSKRKIEFIKNVTESDLPTFTQFLKYIIRHGHEGIDVH